VAPNSTKLKIGLGNYVAGMTTHANPYGAATTWVAWRTRDLSHVSIS